jgi:hypothetical protein
MSKRSGNPAKAAWVPMTQGPLNPSMVSHNPESREAWGNDLYQCTVQYTDEVHGRNGVMALSIKRHDRAAVRDWRHLQQIKNDVAGPEREAVELFPAESRLMDTSNQYWLWVAPVGAAYPVGFDAGAVTDDDGVRLFNDLGTKGRQRPWQPGLTTGRNENTPTVSMDDPIVIDILKKATS